MNIAPSAIFLSLHFGPTFRCCCCCWKASFSRWSASSLTSISRARFSRLRCSTRLRSVSMLICFRRESKDVCICLREASRSSSSSLLFVISCMCAAQAAWPVPAAAIFSEADRCSSSVRRLRNRRIQTDQTTITTTRRTSRTADNPDVAPNAALFEHSGCWSVKSSQRNTPIDARAPKQRGPRIIHPRTIDLRPLTLFRALTGCSSCCGSINGGTIRRVFGVRSRHFVSESPFFSFFFFSLPSVVLRSPLFPVARFP